MKKESDRLALFFIDFRFSAFLKIWPDGGFIRRGGALDHLFLSAAFAGNGGIDGFGIGPQVHGAAAQNVVISRFVAAGEARGDAGALFHGGIDQLPETYHVQIRLKQHKISLAFGQRRKTLVNAVSGKYPKERTAAVLDELGIRADVRGEVLSAEDFSRIADKLRMK